MTELKPCPFCGGEDVEIVKHENGLTYIGCKKCLSKCGMCAGADVAEKLWNSRAYSVLINKAFSKIKITEDEEAKERIKKLYDDCNSLSRVEKMFMLKVIAESIVSASEQGG